MTRRQFLAAVACAPSLPTLFQKRDIDDDVAKWIQEDRVPGLAYAVIEDGKVVHVAGFGVLQRGKPEQVKKDTVFQAASLSKPAFAFVVMQLWQEGQIDIDAPIGKYVPNKYIQEDPKLEKVTPRTVLSHTSGIPHGHPAGQPIVIQREPGKEFHYSAIGFDYLQAAVFEITHMPFAELMQKRFIDPIGMKDSSFDWKPEYETRMAKGHNNIGLPGITLNDRYRTMDEPARDKLREQYPELVLPSAAAGLYTTAEDYAKFLIRMMEPSLQPGHLSARVTGEMLKQQVSAGDSIGWGLGWGIEHLPGDDAFWHWGDWGVYRNFAVAMPKSKRGVVVLTNSNNGPKTYKRVAEATTGIAHPAVPWVANYRG